MKARKETVVYKSVAGCDIKADAHWLPGPERRPVILWLHGGALIFGSRTGLPAYQLNTFLHAGYLVVSADYRLAPQVKLAAILEDIRDLWAWLHADALRLFPIDPERIAVMGQSAGAYLTLVAGYALAPRPRALVSFYGYGDVTGDWYSRPSPHYCRLPAVSREQAEHAAGDAIVSEGGFEERFPFYLYCRQRALWPLHVAGHDAVAEDAWFTPFCPVRNVTKEYPPTLLIHGDADTDVPNEQSCMMDAELARHGVDHQLLTLRGRGHAFDLAAHAEHDPVITETLDRVVALLNRYV